MNKLLSKKITVSGAVQGVGYRYWLQKLCKKHSVKGWVLNKKNGEVEAVLVGINESIFKIILSNCFLGPKKSIPQNILVENIEPKGKIKNFFKIKK